MDLLPYDNGSVIGLQASWFEQSWGGDGRRAPDHLLSLYFGLSDIGFAVSCMYLFVEAQSAIFFLGLLSISSTCVHWCIYSPGSVYAACPGGFWG